MLLTLLGMEVEEQCARAWLREVGVVLDAGWVEEGLWLWIERRRVFEV